MKVYFFRLKGSPKVEGASLYTNEVYRMMKGKPYNDIRMYTASISPCVYGLFKMARSQGKTQDDNFWMARYIEENDYEIAGNIRESYIDGIWNKDDESEWLAELQIPVRKK